MDSSSLLRRWFADEILLGRSLCAIGGYLGFSLILLVYGQLFGLVGVIGFASAVAGVNLLVRHKRGLAAAGLILGGAGLAVAFAAFPFGPGLTIGALLLAALVVTIALVAAPARNTHLLPRITATAVVLVAGVAILGLAAWEAWVVWPEAFSLTLPLDQTYAILRDDERDSVGWSARNWAIATVAGFAVLVILPFIPPLRFGVRRIAATGAVYVAASLVTLVLGSWPVGWNLTDYGYFETEGYWGYLLVREVQGAIIAGALILTAVRTPSEVTDAATATPPAGEYRSGRGLADQSAPGAS